MSRQGISIVVIAPEGRVPKQFENPSSQSGEFSIAYKTSDLSKGVKKLKDFGSSVVLFDIALLEEDRVGFLMKLKISHSELKIILIADRFSVDEWLQYFKSGVRGILEADHVENWGLSAAGVVNQGGLFLEPERMVQFIEHCALKVRQAEEKAGDLLTDREIQVLRLLAEGYTVKKAASLLELSPKTVDTHKANLMRKINVHHRTDLIKYALRKKIISLQEE